MRIMVTGSRTWKDQRRMNEDLAELWRKLGEPVDPILVHGGAQGVDRMARDIWLRRGWDCEEHLADWDSLGKKAGFVRNVAMLKSGIDHVVGFLQSMTPGTVNALEQARVLGIPRTIYISGAC